ncbi:hypothetical protein Pla175_35590 [Pirellulimonas nuda]|uniref:UPF0235 protein Pla175_35590 n=1 Tax=Pirellulimonas nuda TaxID=2528009 RepID=A0A518DFC4_9BACT|nr:DUF167 family protein [Pirellulimonas nuda]QDU90158.1 hypothetical protein Pla175_35590 [Pirellulimonas nuda]
MTQPADTPPNGLEVALEPHAEGVVLPVLARASGRANQFAGVHDGRLRVIVTVAPERGKANAAVVAVVADRLGLRPAEVSVLAGHTNPRKKLLIRGANVAELAGLLRREAGAG